MVGDDIVTVVMVCVDDGADVGVYFQVGVAVGVGLDIDVDVAVIIEVEV